MALTKEIIIDQVEVVGEYKIVQIRTATIIVEDGVELSRSFHRKALSPSIKRNGVWSDTDITGEDASVQAICNAVWTSTVKTAYQESIDANVAQ